MTDVAAAWAEALQRFDWLPSWGQSLILLGGAVSVALIVHALGVALVRRVVKQGDVFWRSLVSRTRRPARLALVLLAISLVSPLLPLREELAALLRQGLHIGMVITISVQSSSITTSVLVPLAASGVLTLENIYPVTLGANVGTTVTALLASLATGSPAAVTVAIVHTLFNLSGIAVFYPVRALRNVPIRLARGLADLVMDRRSMAVAYTVGMFVVVPLLGVLTLR